MLNGTKLIFYFRKQRASEDPRIVLNAIGKVFITNSVFGESSLIEIDFKVHQSACSALKNQDIGSSRGGKNTKR